MSDAVVDLLRQAFEAAVASAQPHVCVPPFIPAAPKGRLIVVGAGKASAAMARAVELHAPCPVSGLVVTRYGHAVDCEHIEIVQAAHPVPDGAGLQAAQRMLQMVQGLSADDVVLCLISGGGSALLPLPMAGISLADKQAIARELLRCGANIGEINTVRRHLSAIKGGRLAAACAPAQVISLLISDVPGDKPIDIASGPTVGDPSTCADALAIVKRYGIDMPEAAMACLQSGQGESVKPQDPRLQNHRVHIVASPQIALEAAAAVISQAGLPVHILSDAIEGEARDVGQVMAAIAVQTAERGQPFATPCVLLSGGETTVTVKGDGRGGRNVEFLLSLGVATQGHARIHALAADTDGIDGQEETAGAFWTPQTLERAHALGLSPMAELDRNNGHGFFEALGQQVGNGPTRTNVNDFRAIHIAGL